MGARVYIASMGRFLQVDPVEGGTDNTYAYVNDPVNDFDLTGAWSWRGAYNRLNNFVQKTQSYGYRLQSWCSKNTIRNYGCSAGFMILTTGRSKGAKEEGFNWAKGPRYTKTSIPGSWKRIPAQKAPFNSHGQAVYKVRNRYITPDVDAHKGGTWKMFDLKGRRVGTYDEYLRRIGN